MKKIMSLVISFAILITGFATISANASFSFLLGDVNADGVVSTADVQSILLKKGEYDPCNNEYDVLGDTDFDNSFTDNDARAVLKIAAGISLCETLEFSDWEISFEPTCESIGYETSVCESTGAVRTKPVDKIQHNFVDGVCSMCSKTQSVTGTISVNQKTIAFGDSVSSLKSKFGTPTDILSDCTPSGGVEYYVYAQDYSELTIFTCSDVSGVVGVYSVSPDFKVIVSETISFDNVEDFYECSGVYFDSYYDNIGTKSVYAFFATMDYELLSLSPDSDFTSNEMIIYYTTNACRALNNCEPLSYNAELARMAEYHTVDMATNNYFSHDGLNGETFISRVEEYIPDCLSAGENIEAGNILNAYEFTDGWYNSQGHRENMLNDMYEDIGVGIFYDSESDYLYYSTQNFASF